MFGRKRIWQSRPALGGTRAAEYLSTTADHGGPARAEPAVGGPPYLLSKTETGALTVVTSQLRQEVLDRKLAEDQFKIHLDRLEQRIKGHSVELIEIKEQLRHLCDELAEKMTEIKTANERLQQQVVEREHYVNEKVAVLTRTVQQLQHQLGQLKKNEIELLEDIIDAKPPAEQIDVLNPQELKALSELAKRLAQ